MEGLLDVGKVVVAPPTRWRCLFPGEVGDTVRGFHPRRLGVVVGGQPVAFVMSRRHCPGEEFDGGVRTIWS